MCAKCVSVDDIPLSQLNNSAYAVLSKHLDTLNTFRRDWRRIAREINLTLKEMNMVESCNEHMRKLIEIWSKTPPYPKLINLIDILENLGCEDAIAELRECLEGYPMDQIRSPIRGKVQNTVVGGPGIIPSQIFQLTKPILDAFIESQIDNPVRERERQLPAEIDNEPVPKAASITELSEREQQMKDGFFVSYHDNDEKIGKEIVDAMKEKGVLIYSQEDIYAGDCQINRREELFQKSRSVIAVISPDYVRDEGYHQLEAISGVNPSPSGSKRTFIPVIYKPVKDLPSFIRSRGKVDWNRADKFTRLYNSIKDL